MTKKSLVNNKYEKAQFVRHILTGEPFLILEPILRDDGPKGATRFTGLYLIRDSDYKERKFHEFELEPMDGEDNLVEKLERIAMIIQSIQNKW